MYIYIYILCIEIHLCIDIRCMYIYIYIYYGGGGPLALRLLIAQAVPDELQLLIGKNMMADKAGLNGFKVRNEASASFVLIRALETEFIFSGWTFTIQTEELDSTAKSSNSRLIS